MQMTRKKQQWVGVALVLAIGATLFIIVTGVLGRSPQSLISGAGDGVIDTRIVADRTSGASPEDIWINSAEKQVEALAEQLASMTKLLKESEAAGTEKLADLEVQFAKRLAELEGNTADAVMDLAGRIGTDGQEAGVTSLPPETGVGADVTDEVKLASIRNAPPLDEFVSRSAPGGQPLPDGSIEVAPRRAQAGGTDPNQSFRQDGPQGGLQGGIETPAVRAPMIESFALKPRPEPAAGIARRRTLSNYVPAGSYAPGVVLTGADAKTGTENAANPIPVILKLTGPAVGPADVGRLSHINLEGCRVMGSAIADLSSERVSVRLDTISCVRGGDVLEAKVAGYVSGQGQQGVRGRLYSRAGPAIKNAAIAAALEGLAGSVGGAGQSIVGLETAGKTDVLKTAPLQALSGGAQGAASKLADYYIDRAEQLSPVVSLFAGTQVNVVFLEGVDFSGEG